jgi:hypothetical protein
MSWILGPWPLFLSSLLWLVQAVAYGHRKDWGHVIMSLSYCTATWGLIYAWFRPVLP